MHISSASTQFLVPWNVYFSDEFLGAWQMHIFVLVNRVYTQRANCGQFLSMYADLVGQFLTFDSSAIRLDLLVLVLSGEESILVS